MVLPASMRLKGHRCFSHLQKSGRRFHGSSMILRVVKAEPLLLQSHLQHQSSDSTCKCAIAISTKVSKKSVIRNKMRRLFHEHLKARLENHKTIPAQWALISLKPSSSQKDLKNLLEECDKLLSSAGLIQ